MVTRLAPFRMCLLLVKLSGFKSQKGKYRERRLLENWERPSLVFREEPDGRAGASGARGSSASIYPLPLAGGGGLDQLATAALCLSFLPCRCVSVASKKRHDSCPPFPNRGTLGFL